MFWLREGDRNTKKFHALTKQRRARNKIMQLMDADGNIVEDEKGLVPIATSYFRQIFESSQRKLKRNWPKSLQRSLGQ